jgi:AhpC/TSA family
MVQRKKRRTALLPLALLSGLFAIVSTALAVEVGDKAPDFKLPATTGVDVSLSDYRGKKWVLLEFYGADFQPT